MNVRAAWAWTAASLYACLILSISSIQRPPVSPDFQKYHGDWVFHMVEYGVFGILLVRAWSRTRPAADPRVWLLGALLTASAFGIFDEWYQGHVPGRNRDPRDWAADTAGAGAALLLWRKKTQKGTACPR